MEALLEVHPEILSYPDEELVDGAQEHIVVYAVKSSRWQVSLAMAILEMIKAFQAGA